MDCSISANAQSNYLCKLLAITVWKLVTADSFYSLNVLCIKPNQWWVKCSCSNEVHNL